MLRPNYNGLFLSCFGLNSLICTQPQPVCSSRKIENYSVQCYNTLSQATNGFTAWKSNQHLHHLILQPKNTSADITSTQGASNYLTSRLLDSYMAITQGVLMLEQKKKQLNLI